jgi:hypothetical protein
LVGMGCYSCNLSVDFVRYDLLEVGRPYMQIVGGAKKGLRACVRVMRGKVAEES